MIENNKKKINWAEGQSREMRKDSTKWKKQPFRGDIDKEILKPNPMA